MFFCICTLLIGGNKELLLLVVVVLLNSLNSLRERDKNARQALHFISFPQRG